MTGLPEPIADLTRDFTVAVFVVARGRVLLHLHRKLGLWLPPGGHIELHELPDDAALREVLEETGLAIELSGGRGLPTDHPGEARQLTMPAGIQLEPITPGHEHIDLVYFARPVDGVDPDVLGGEEGFKWCSPDDLAGMDLTNEVRSWCARALLEVADR